MVRSCRDAAALDAKQYITGHERGLVDGEAFRDGMTVFLSKIDNRDRFLLESLKTPMTLDELARLGIVYPRKFHEDAWVSMWNRLMTKKHLQRLEARGRVREENGRFFVAR